MHIAACNGRNEILTVRSMLPKKVKSETRKGSTSKKGYGACKVRVSLAG
jgi:hypothetical protein